MVIRRQRREEDWMPNQYTTVCSEHFHKSDLRVTKSGKTLLNKNAVPFFEDKSHGMCSHGHEHQLDYDETDKQLDYFDEEELIDEEQRLEEEQFNEEEYTESSLNPENSDEFDAYNADIALSDTQIRADIGEQNEKQIEDLSKIKEELGEFIVRSRTNDKVACGQIDEQREAEEQMEEEEEFILPSMKAGLKAISVLRKLVISCQELHGCNFEDTLIQMERKIQNVQWDNYKSWPQEQIFIKEEPSSTSEIKSESF